MSVINVAITFTVRVLMAATVIAPIEPDPARGFVACAGLAAILGVEVGWEWERRR